MSLLLLLNGDESATGGIAHPVPFLAWMGSVPAGGTATPVFFYHLQQECEIMYLRQATANQEILLGPFIDSTDGNTAETALTIANTDIKIWKEGGTTESNKNSGGATHIAAGRYYAVLDATDSDTVGKLEVNVHVAGALPMRTKTFYVLEEAIYDAFYAASAPGYIANAPVNVAQLSGDSTAADNAEAFFDGTGYAGTNNVIPTVTTTTNVTNQVTANVTAISGDSVAADNAESFFDGTGYAGTGNVIPTVTTVTNQVTSNVTAISGDATAADNLEAALDGTGGVTITAGLTGNVTGNLSGSVGSVTGNVGGNVVGSVASVVGAVGSVAGNVDGSVASIATGGITAGSIAADAIGASELAADAVAEIQSGLATAASIAALNNLSAAQVNAEVDTALADIHLDHLLAADYDPASKPGVSTALFNELIESNAGVSRYTAAALAQAPSGTADWTADERTAIRTILGVPTSGTTPEEPAAGALKVIDDFLDAEVAAIKAKTDNLPTDPADASDIASSFSTVNSTLATIATYIDTEVAAIKAKTDNLPTDPADQSAVEAAITAAQVALVIEHDATQAAIAALNNLSSAGAQTAANAALVAMGLDHLVSASVTGTDITDNSIIAKLASKSATADWDDFANTTDSLQAIRDRGDVAWTTGAGGAGGSVTVVMPPITAISADRIVDSTLRYYVGETFDSIVTILDANAAALDLSSYTLQLVFEKPDRTDLSVIEAADITVSGAGNNVITFTVPTTLTTKERLGKWSLRNETDGLVLAGGVYHVEYKAIKDV